MLINGSAFKYWWSTCRRGHRWLPFVFRFPLIILVTRVVIFMMSIRQVEGFPCPTKGLLVDTLPSLSSQHFHLRAIISILRMKCFHCFFLSWVGTRILADVSPKSNIFCARVLWTEILALNWIRCRRSNSKTMKRQNSEAKPLLKCLSHKIKQFRKLTFLSTLLIFKNLSKVKSCLLANP